MLVLREIATADVAALQTKAQMHPWVAGFDALLAYVLICTNNSDLIEMCTFSCHRFSFD